MRKYLVNIHRFYFHFYKDSFDAPIMPCIIAGVTLSCFLGMIDLVFNHGGYITELKEFHRFAVTIPGYFFIFILYIYYRGRLPDQKELSKGEGKWLGVILSILSIVGLTVVSIVYPIS